MFVRKTGVNETNIIEVDIKETMKFIKENRKNKDKFQIIKILQIYKQLFNFQILFHSSLQNVIIATRKLMFY